MAKALTGGINTRLDVELHQSKRLRGMYYGYYPLHPRIYKARGIEGIARDASTHAEGVVITEQPVWAYVALASKDGELVCQFQMTRLE